MSDTAVPNEELLFDLEEAMRDVVDPELGINVVDLGLVYGLNVEKGEQGTVALLDMTLTSPACPLTDVIEDQSRNALVGSGLVFAGVMAGYALLFSLYLWRLVPRWSAR